MSDPEKKLETSVPPATSGTASASASPMSPAATVAAVPTVEEVPAVTVTPPVSFPIPLKFPFKSGERTLREIAFTRRPKAKDMIQTHGAETPLEQELYTIAALLGVNAEDLKEMDGQDYLTVQREYAAFLGQ